MGCHIFCTSYYINILKVSMKLVSITSSRHTLAISGIYYNHVCYFKIYNYDVTAMNFHLLVSLLVICSLEFRGLFYLHADMQRPLSLYPLYGCCMQAWI